MLGVDVIVSDPPYGIGYVKGKGGGLGIYSSRRGVPKRNIQAIAGDDEPFDPSHLLRFDNVLLWGADHYSDRLPHGRFLAWDKLDGYDAWDSFSDVEFAWHNKRGASRIIRYVWKGLCQGAGEDKGSTRLHPTQKPVTVMRWSIEQAGIAPNSLVCDPYFGSGTTAVACVRMGHRFVGCEIDPAHFATAVSRITAELNRCPLFKEEQPTQRSMWEEDR